MLLSSQGIGLTEYLYLKLWFQHSVWLKWTIGVLLGLSIQNIFFKFVFYANIENHGHKQCWRPRFGCWPQRKSMLQKPCLSDHQKKFFTGQQILTQLLAHRNLHQKIKLASLQCSPLSLQSEWRRLSACESLTYFCTVEAKRSWSRISDFTVPIMCGDANTVRCTTVCW